MPALFFLHKTRSKVVCHNHASSSLSPNIPSTIIISHFLLALSPNIPYNFFWLTGIALTFWEKISGLFRDDRSLSGWSRPTCLVRNPNQSWLEILIIVHDFGFKIQLLPRDPIDEKSSSILVMNSPRPYWSLRLGAIQPLTTLRASQACHNYFVRWWTFRSLKCTHFGK